MTPYDLEILERRASESTLIPMRYVYTMFPYEHNDFSIGGQTISHIETTESNDLYHVYFWGEKSDELFVPADTMVTMQKPTSKLTVRPWRRMCP